MIKKSVWLCILLILMPFTPSEACTMIMVAKKGVLLAGNNEDWKNPKTYVWFVPASEKAYGRVCFGFDRGFGYAQGGMNDQGLFIDGNALSPTGWKAAAASGKGGSTSCSSGISQGQDQFQENLLP